mmetsp:Transcript_33593/g.75403  ORF Transcript_33593/g.75403 Transcript_33593/m.75403 type:complete len:534 (+) Transcript_33593:70-1671(+)
MISVDPGDVPCFMLLQGVQVPRVIGKAGAIIKELRAESGASINILDKQLPEALQKHQSHVAFAKGSAQTLRPAVVGLVRNARGPQAIRALDPEEAGSPDVAFLVPAACEGYLKDAELTAETQCSVHVEVLEGMQKHRKVILRAQETHDLQIVSWRLQELQIRMSQAALLTDRDFDLQDSAWAGAMEAFRAKRQEEGVAQAGTSPPMPMSRLPSLPSASAEIEQEARKAREAHLRDLEVARERERKRQIREDTAREQQECQNAAREAKMLADKARDIRLQAAEATSQEKRDALVQEAMRVEEQARQARARSTRGYGTGPRAQQHEYQEDNQRASAVAPAEDKEARALLRQQEEREQLRKEQERRDESAREKQRREREALKQAGLWVEAQSKGLAPPSGSSSEGGLERREQEEQLLRDRRQERERELLQQAHSPEVRLLEPKSEPKEKEPQRTAAPVTSKSGEVALLVRAPSLEAAQYLASSHLGIGLRSGTKLSVAPTAEFGFPLLKIWGTPVANAVASYLLQEALWMSGCFAN